MTLIELYVGQPTAAQLVAFLDESGFELVSADAENIDPDTGRVNWLNMTFSFRRRRLRRATWKNDNAWGVSAYRQLVSVRFGLGDG